MTDIRHRLEQLLCDSSTYAAGRHDERLRLQQLIDIRVDELHDAPSLKNREQLCAELLRLRQQLEP